MKKRHIEGKRQKGDTFTEKSEPDSDTLRLNKFISNSGVCSRREADNLIARGKVTVNGKKVTEMGLKVKKSDKVTVNDKLIKPEKKVYVLLNKPKDCISTSSDEKGRRTVLDVIKGAADVRLYPIGRLDRNTTGLLLLTNDGDLARLLSHPGSNIKKIYHVILDKPLDLKHFEEIKEGIKLEDGFFKPDNLSYVEGAGPSDIGIELHSGRNRIVRRVFEHFGYEVVKLDRVIYAGLTKKDLPRGKWRYLSPKELDMMRYFGIGKTKMQKDEKKS